MKYWAVLLLFTLPLWPQTPAPEKAPASPTILNVKRIYVAELTGGAPADALRELLIAGINSTKLFVLTENPEHADAVLKGAADDHTFEDTFDSSTSVSSRGGSGKNSGSSRSSGSYLSSGVADNDSHHIKERKHEAFAAVRLVNSDGDVLWSTTQESLGGKFRGASADVAAKVAHQLSLDYEIARRVGNPLSAPQ
jgi:curved DNA-binding protein CbpA